MSQFNAGQVVGGKYELVRPLGRGSMGEVWAGYHRTLFEEVAIKLLSDAPDSGACEDPSTAAVRFRFEAQVAARLSRKTRHIVRVTDHGEEGGLAYLIMELLEGQTLAARLQSGGCMTLRETANLLTQIARALEQAHRAGVVHRDLKPANVFLAHGEDREDLVKVLDFGIARATHTVRIASAFSTAAGFVFGTPGYMSPEQALPGARLDERCDLWALSTIAYEALTDELPVAGAYTEELMGNLIAGRIVPIRERKPELPVTLANFFETAFARNIDARFRSARDLVRHFDRAVATSEGTGLRIASGQTLQGSTLPITFPMRCLPPSPETEGRQQRRNASRLAVALSLAGLLFGFLAVGATWFALGTRTRMPERGSIAGPAAQQPPSKNEGVGSSGAPAPRETMNAVEAPAATPAPEAASNDHEAIQARIPPTIVPGPERVQPPAPAAAGETAPSLPAALGSVPSATPPPSSRAPKLFDRSNVL